MLAYMTSMVLLFLAEGGNAGGQGWWYENVDPYLNSPGFEVWRFLNLAIFILILVYFLKKPLSDAFKAKRDAIRADLIKAEEEKRAAEERLQLAESRLEGFEDERRGILREAESEAAAERERIEADTGADIERLEGQAETEISRKVALAGLELKRHSARQSIELAEKKIRNSIDAAKDAELVSASIKAIGGGR